MSTPIERTVESWHRYLRGDLPGGLDELLDDDVVFLSPIVFTPQKGRELTELYLRGASASFGGGAGPHSGPPTGRSFHYVKEVVAGDHAVLEFEAEVDGIVVNGVDVLTVDDNGKIVEFKVMLRPLKAIELMHRKMRDALAELVEADGG